MHATYFIYVKHILYLGSLLLVFFFVFVFVFL